MFKKVHKSRLLYHIQDLQIEAARDLEMIKSKRVINMLFSVEKYILNNSDVISSISEGMVDKIQKKANRDVFLFPNWTDITVFFPIKNQISLKEQFGFASTDKIILYSGAIGEKQGLESIIHAANEFKDKEQVKFVICGSGPYKVKLQELTKKLNLNNVIFFPLQQFEKFNQFLNIADVHLVIQKANASDLVMPSKLTTILAVGGLAVITANKGAGLHTLVEKYEMGYLVDAENQEALNIGINRAIENDLSIIARNARKYAENHLSIERVMQSFQEHFLLGHITSTSISSISSEKVGSESFFGVKSF